MTPSLAMAERAWKIVRRGKRQFERYQKHEYYLEDNLLAINDYMLSDRLKPDRMGMRHIAVPKPREVQVPSVRDKLIMHILCDNVLYDAVAAQLGEGVSACMIGRGTEYGTKRAEHLLKDHWREYHAVPYILKGDVHSYFASVDRDRIAALAAEAIPDEDALRISRKYIYYDAEPKGMPLGLQQNQCYGNLYLAELDRMITEECGYRRYGRHMDDFYVIAPTREELETLLGKITDKLAEIGLALNPKTTIERGKLDYLGFTHLLTEDGKHVLRLQNSKKKAKKRELKMIVRELQAGHLTVEKVRQRYQGWRQRGTKQEQPGRELRSLARPISTIDLSEKLYYEETINDTTVTVEYWPIRKDADGVVLLRGKALDQSRRMNNTNVATYIDSVMDAWLNDTTAGYLSYFDAKMRACIILTEILVKPYDSDTATTIARQAWLLSESEVTTGGVEGDSILPMLKTHSGETNDNAARKAYNSAGSAVYSWLRSVGSAEQFRYVYSNGIVNSSSATGNICPRPAFKVANATMVSDQGEDTIYILPDSSKLYRELSFVVHCGASAQRPKKAKVQVTITNAAESTIWISNNAKDAEPAWVTCTNDEVVELPNTAKTTDSWELGVKIYAKSGGCATCSEPVIIVETEEVES